MSALKAKSPRALNFVQAARSVRWGVRATAILVAASLLAGGCASPAKPKNVTNGPAQPLNGVYEAEFVSRFFGPLRTRFTAEAITTKGPQQGPLHSFKANTRPGVAWNLIGGLAGAVGPLFAPFIFPQGMLLVWTSDMPVPSDAAALAPGQMQTPGQGRMGPSTLSKWQAKTLYRGENFPVEIRIEDTRTISLMSIRRLDEMEAAAPFPKPDYAALVADYHEVFKRDFMDPVQGSSSEHEAMARRMNLATAGASDDVEFLTVCAMAWRDYPKFPLPAIYRRPDPAKCEELFSSITDEQRPLMVTKDPASGVVTIEVIAFLNVEQIDVAFSQAIAMQPAALIIDLRLCPGLESAAFRAASWLLVEPFDAGTLVGASRRKSVFGESETATDSATRAGSAAAAPQITVRNAADIANLDATLDREGWARIRIEPEPTAFAGKVMVLTSRRTLSTAEILADILKSSGRAITIGGRTGKRANLSRDRDLPSVPGWCCRLPCFDYVRPSGDALSATGVVADIETPRSEAKSAAMKLVVAP